ncbi:hypothetical protein XENOCAPTIV_009507 [Xenoophorus captivus]|uniref:Uncharacterized protein n=1 Tax=Xenoophorus captivus TaxID=1517983 RepID=A0ABV0QZM5_9TELE
MLIPKLNQGVFEIPLDVGCGLEILHPALLISWESGWRNVADFGRRQPLRSTPFSLPALRLSLPNPSHAQLKHLRFGLQPSHLNT